MRLPPQDLELVRTQPQQTKLHLSIFRPQVIFKARVNGDVARGDRVIPYDSVTLGGYGIVEAGQTLLVGSADGLRDKGKIRIRSIDGTTITLAENSDINWRDDDFLTIIRFWEIWAVYPRIVNDPNDNESVVFYKDYDIEYTNQNSVLGTFVNAGPHRALFRDCASGLAETQWSSTGTYNLASGSVASYEWAFEGGTPTGSALANPGTVTYNTPGHYVTRLRVSGTVGGMDETYRYVSVYDYPGCGASTPPLKWTLNSLGGSRGQGGYNAQITLHEIVDINEGDVVVILQENWYGGQKRSLGGNHPNTSQIVFSGYILDNSITINYRNSTMEFQAGSVSMVMKQGEGFSCSVESVNNPSTWFELRDMDIRRAIYHYLRWHTTVLNVTDVEFKGTDQKIQFFDADRGSLYDAIDSLIRSALVGQVVADKQSKLWLEVDAYAVPNATGTYTPIMYLEKRDWMNEPRIDERLTNETSFIEMGGIAYSGSQTGTFAALLTNAPGSAPSYRGKVERTQGLALANQSQLNQLAGNVLTWKNSAFPIIDVEFTGNYSHLDIAPQEAIQVDIAPEDNMRGKRINNPYYVSELNWDFDSEKGIFVPRANLNIITTGEAGETLIIPEIPPSEGFGAGGDLSTFPTIPFPSTGVLSYILMTADSLSGAGVPGWTATRRVGEFVGVSPVFQTLIPSSGLYLISFTSDNNIDETDTNFMRIREYASDQTTVMNTALNLFNLHEPTDIPSQAHGFSITVAWYVTGGHYIRFTSDLNATGYSAHASIIKLTSL